MDLWDLLGKGGNLTDNLPPGEHALPAMSPAEFKEWRRRQKEQRKGSKGR